MLDSSMLNRNRLSEREDIWVSDQLIAYHRTETSRYKQFLIESNQYFQHLFLRNARFVSSFDPFGRLLALLIWALPLPVSILIPKT